MKFLRFLIRLFFVWPMFLLTALPHWIFERLARWNCEISFWTDRRY